MMDINRYNYETFFLLYADNELSATEKNSVDEFVQSNPDLGEELVMLLQTILQKTDIVFNEKMSVYKKAPLSVNVQEKLLLHLDNELPEVEKKELFTLIASCTAVSEEWAMIQSAKFFPESTLFFEDKKSLYRSEKGRLAFLPWRKLLTAAILVGVGLWGGLMYFNSDSKISNQAIPNLENKLIAGEIKKNSSKLANQISKLAIVQQKKRTNIRPSDIDDDLANFFAPKTEKKILPSEENKTEETQDSNNSHSELFNLITKIVDKEKSNNLPNNDAMQEKQPADNLKELDLNLVADQQIIGQTLVMNTSYRDERIENNNQIFFIGEEKIKKIMKGGFLVKVKKLLERRSNSPNIRNTIKVANFEFTIR
jgi:hypothetical protein